MPGRAQCSSPRLGERRGRRCSSTRVFPLSREMDPDVQVMCECLLGRLVFGGCRQHGVNDES